MLLGLARCRFNQSRLEEAEGLLDDLLARQPDMPAALGERGRLALAQRQPERAESWLRLAATALPHDREIIYNLVRCLERLDKHADAEEHSARLRRIDEDLARMGGLIQQVLKTPNSASLRHDIGVLFLRNGFLEDGVNWLRTALEQDPSYRPAHQALAEHYRRTGKLDAAERHRRAAAASHGNGSPHQPETLP
jgi:Tfp pilus assembly protein PilF